MQWFVAGLGVDLLPVKPRILLLRLTSLRTFTMVKESTHKNKQINK